MLRSQKDGLNPPPCLPNDVVHPAVEAVGIRREHDSFVAGTDHVSRFAVRQVGVLSKERQGNDFTVGQRDGLKRIHLADVAEAEFL